MNLDKHDEGDILEYIEGLIISEQFDRAREFYDENKAYIIYDIYKPVPIFLSFCISRFKNEIDDAVFLEEISKLSATIKPTWSFEDMNNYLRPLLSSSTYDRMLEMQTRFKEKL